MKHVERTAACLLCLLAWGGVTGVLPARAQEPPATPETPIRTIREYESARVAGRKYIRVLQPMELSGRKLNAYRGYSVADAVRYYSGLLFKDYGGLAGFKTINVRSLGSERINVFYNGIELHNAYNGQVDLAKFSLDNIGGLALYSGQKGDIFQSATDFASAGSLYITSRRPTFQPDVKTNFKAGVRGGSFFTVNPSLYYEHDLGNYITTTASLEFLTSNGEYPFHYRRYNAEGEKVYDFRAHRRNNAIYASRAEASLHGIFDRGVWNMFLYHYGSTRGIPGAIVNNVTYRGERITERNSFLQGNVKIDVADGYQTQVNYKLGFDYTRYVNEDDKIVRIDNTFRQYEAYLSNSHLYTVMEDLDLTAAYDVQFAMLRKYDEVLDRPAANFGRPMQLKNLLSLAAQYSVGDVQMQGSVLGTFVNSFDKKGYDSYGNHRALTPAFLVSYTPWKRIDFSVQAYVKQTFRLPNYNDRYLSEVEGDRLNPEKMLQYSLGVIYSQKQDAAIREYGVTAEGYYHDVRDKIIAYPKGQLFRWSMVNLGRVRIVGADAMAYMRYRALGELEITTRVQYRFQQARDVTNRHDSYYKNQIPNIPLHSGSATVSMGWRGWMLNYSFLYVGTRYGRQENIPYYELQPWYTHDVSLGKGFTLGGWAFKCLAEVNNVFGQDFEIVANYPMPKQMYRLTLTAEL